MPQFLRIIFLIITVAIISAGCKGGAGSDLNPELSDTDTIQGQSFNTDQLRSVGKMEFGSMTVTKTVTTDRTKWYKIGKRVGIYSFDIFLKAYVDLQDFKDEDVIIDEAVRTVSVRMPEVKIEIVGRSPELRMEYEHIDLFRSRPDSKERAQLKETATRDFMKEFNSNPEFKRNLEKTARLKAGSYVASLITARGYRAIIDGTDVTGAVILTADTIPGDYIRAL